MADRNRFAATQGSLVLAVRDGRDPHSVAAPAPLCEIYRPPVTVVLEKGYSKHSLRTSGTSGARSSGARGRLPLAVAIQTVPAFRASPHPEHEGTPSAARGIPVKECDALLSWKASSTAVFCSAV